MYLSSEYHSTSVFYCVLILCAYSKCKGNISLLGKDLIMAVQLEKKIIYNVEDTYRSSSSHERYWITLKRILNLRFQWNGILF